MDELTPKAKSLLAAAKAQHREPLDPELKRRIKQGVLTATLGVAMVSKVQAAAKSQVAWYGTATAKLLATGLAVSTAIAGVTMTQREARIDESTARSTVADHQPTARKQAEESAPARTPPSLQTVAPETVAPTAQEPSKARPTSLPVPSLARELALLESASEALARGDTSRGSALLKQHRQHFQNSALRREREELEVLAACQRGDSDARDRAQTLLARDSGSVLRETLREKCQLP